MKKTKKLTAILLSVLSVTSFAGCNLADETEQIANVVTDTYFKVENFFVDSYEKVENQFIEWFFAKDGETVEDAKDRLEQNK